MDTPSTSHSSTEVSNTPKRQASPIINRNVRQKENTDLQIDTNMNDTSNETAAEASSAPQENNTTVPKQPISNKYFATFKSLRKLNSKAVTADHHLTFLKNLREKNLVPKGLQVKAVNIGIELPPDLYEQWENAHIALASSRRDILIQYWQRHMTNLQKAISEATARLGTVGATEEEITHITNTLVQTRVNKEEELKARCLRKNTRETAASARGGGGTTTPRA
jgi:hypothetical protein